MYRLTTHTTQYVLNTDVGTANCRLGSAGADRLMKKKMVSPAQKRKEEGGRIENAMRGRTLLEAIAARRAVDQLVLQHDRALLQLDGTEGEQLRESIVRELTEVIRHLTTQPLKPVCVANADVIV